MNKDHKRRFEMIVASSAVALEHRAIIERANDGAEMIANLDAAVANLRRRFSAGETGGRESHGTTSTRREARTKARRTLDSIRRFAVSLGTTGLDEKFQIPKSCSDQRLAAVARGIIEQATPLVDRLVRHGMPKDTLDELASHVQAIDE